MPVPPPAGYAQAADSVRSARGVAVPRKFLTKLLPTQEKLHAKLHGKWYLKPFDFLLHDPILWHIGRRSTCRALALGAFIACLPVPGHTVLAVLGAIFWRMNLPVAIAAIWINNPLTIVPIFLAAHRLGTWTLELVHLDLEARDRMLGTGPIPELTRAWHILEPTLLGGMMEGLIFGLVAYSVLDLAWRVSINSRWRLRKLERTEENAKR